MAKAAGAGYRSPLNLQLSQLPKVTNNEVFPDMVEVFNAIHTLNAYIDTVVEGIYNNDKDLSLPEQLRFLTSLWLKAGEDLEVGDICRFAAVGVVKGVVGAMTCIVLEAAPKDELVKVGFGPGVLEVPGAKIGDNFFAKNGDFRGQLLAASVKGAIHVAYCFVDGYILFAPHWFNTRT